MKMIDSFLKRVLLSTLVVAISLVNLPVMTTADDVEQTVNEEINEVVEENNLENIQDDFVVEQKQDEQIPNKESQINEVISLEDNKEVNETVEQVTEELNQEEVEEEIVQQEEPLINTEENIQQEEVVENIEEEIIEEENKELAPMPMMAMLGATPQLTASAPSYSVTYGEETDDYVLKKKASENIIYSITGVDFDSTYCEVNTSGGGFSPYVFSIKGKKVTTGTSATIKYKTKWNGSELSYTFNVTVNPKSLPTASVTYSVDNPAQYSGSSITNNITVKDGNTTLVKDVDYTISGTLSETQPGTYNYTITGIGNYTGTQNGSWKISAAIANADISTKKSNYYYTGSEVKPELNIKWNGNDIDASKYTITYQEGRVNVGSYWIKVTANDGSGFEGSKQFYFNIEKIEDGVSISKNELTYDGTNQNLVKVDSNIGNRTIYYYKSSYEFSKREALQLASNGKWSTTIPTEKDAGTYHVYWKADGNGNCEEIPIYVSNHIEVKINQKSIAGLVSVNKSSEGYKYTGSKQKVSLNTSLTEGEKNDYTLSGTYEATEPKEYNFYVNGVGNYTGTVELTWKINQSTDLSTATIILSKTELAYNGTSQGPDVTKVTIGGEEVNSNYYTASVTKGINVGQYNVKVVPSAAGITAGYTSEKTTTYNIVKGSKVAKVNAASNLVYNGSSQNLITLSNVGNQTIYYFVSETDYSSDAYLDAALIAGGGWSESIPSKKNAGTYYVYWKADGNDNCEAIDKYHNRRAVVTISPKTITENMVTVSYAGEDDTQKSAKDYIVVKDGSTTLTSSDITIENVTGTTANTYPTKITGKGNYTGEITVNFVISEKTNFATVNKKDNITYNGDYQTLLKNVAVTKGEVQYKLGSDGSWSTSVPSAKNAGNYTVYYRVPSGADYNAIYGSVDVTINRKNLNDSSIKVNVTSDLTYNGYSQFVTFEIKDGTKQMSLLTEYVVKDGTSGKSATTHHLTLEGVGNYTGTKDVEWEIKPASISNATIIITNNLVYNGQSQEVKFTVAHNIKELDLGEDYEVSGTTNKATDAGSHTLKIVGKGDFTGELTKSFTINQATIQVGGNDIGLTNSAFSANTLTYSGLPQVSLTQKSNIVGLDNKEVLYRVNEGDWGKDIPELTNAGVYKVGYKIVTKEGKESNYKDYGDNIAEPIIVTVAPKKLVKADFEIVPSSTDFTGSAITAEIKPINISASEGTDYNVVNKSNLTQTEPGTYTVVLTTIASNSGNYTNEVFNLTYDWTIDKKAIDNTFSVSFYKALCTGESINVKDYVKEIKYNNAVLTSDDYEITDSYSTKGNHNVTITGKGSRFKGSHTFNNVFTIDDGDLTFTATAYNQTYDSNSHAAISDVVIKCGDKQISGMNVRYSIDNGVTWTNEIPTIKNAGEYTVKYHVFEGKDNDDDYHTGCIGNITGIKISKAEISNISITQDTYTYNGLNKKIEFKVYAGTLELNSTDYTLTGYTSASNTPSVELANTTDNMKPYCQNDKYKFTVVGKENGNFTGSKDAYWTINKVSVEDAIVTQGITPIVYDGNSHLINVTSVFVNLLPASYDVECTSQTDAGLYSATIKGKGNFNGEKVVNWSIEQADILVNGKAISHFNQPIEKIDSTYDTQSHKLIKFKDGYSMIGQSDVTPIRYSFDKSNWTYNIDDVVKTDAGEYRVYYQVYGTKNYKNYGFTIEDYIDVKIAPYTLTSDNFKIELSNDMIEEGDVTYDATGTHVEYNGEDVVAKLVGTIEYPDPDNPDEYKTYTLKPGSDYILYSQTTSAKNAGTYGFILSAIISNNFVDKGIVITKLWSIDKAHSKLNIVDEDFTFNGKKQQLINFDETKPSNVKGLEDSAYYLISETSIEEPLDSLGWTNDLDEISRKDAGTYYIYYATPGNDNCYPINDVKVVTIKKYEVDKDDIVLTGSVLTEEKDGQGNFKKKTQTFEIRVDEDTETEDVLSYDDEDVIITYDQNKGLYSNQGYQNGAYEFKLSIAESNKNYKGSNITKAWAINGTTFNNEQQDTNGSYEVKNVVLDKDKNVKEDEQAIAKLETTSYDILNAIATPQDMSEIALGNKINIFLNSIKVEETVVDTNIKKGIENKAKDLTVATFIDISLFKQLVEVEKDPDTGDVISENPGDITPITQLFNNKTIRISVPIDESLIISNDQINRIYNIVRAHNGVYDILPAEFNKEEKTLSFETDRFSTYAIAYKDINKNTNTVAEYENVYEWSKDYRVCKASRLIKGTDSSIFDETVASYVEIIEPKVIGNGYVVYSASFTNKVFETQTIKLNLNDDNYPSIIFKQGNSEIDGEAKLISGGIYTNLRIVSNDINLNIDEDSINSLVNNVQDVYPFELQLQDINGKIVELDTNNKYSITLKVPSSISFADDYYLAKVNSDNTITLLETNVDDTNMTIGFVTQELGNYVIITSKEEEVYIDTTKNDKDNHNLTHIIGGVLLALMIILSVITYNKNFNSLNIAAIVLGLINAVYLLIKGSCMKCWFILAGVTIVGLYSVITKLINKE